MAFDILPDGEYPPVHYRKAIRHLIFDVRMALERRAIWVKDGHKTPQPEWSNFAGVLYHEIIRTNLVYVALNDLPFLVLTFKMPIIKLRSWENIPLFVVPNLV